ncbi:uncharacterized protein LOC118454313 [Neolamprologus brichardi]|uniref:uncharacterized protein LOC118454313 n=1 Tax=Neolamprologus brichardi TaxID=32507 RepID=UPI001643CBA2|nr:uncharacterized protein LOC118454313 [Neolamprologus brichardi]
MTLLRDPPAQGKYTALKALLLRRYSLSDAERAEKLLSLAGLGDGTALELMESMLSLLGADDGGFLFTHLFLRQLPAPVRAGLANSPLLATKDYRSLAEEADRILLATRSFSVQAIVQDSPAFSPAPSPMLQGPSDSSTVAGIAARRHLSRPREMGMSALCSNKERLLFLEDSRSGRRFLVDSGTQKSLLPPAGSDRLAEGCGPLLTAANGSSIKTFGERLVTVCFYDRDFQWNFVVAASSVPIIGADFLCAHGLLVDVANRRLIDAVSFSSLPCLTRGAQPVVHANSVDSGDVFQCLLSEFPSLTVPTFSSTVTKHGVKHYITTVGPPVFARARRLDPAKLAVAREEFATMERLGIVQRSNSAWASPLHMVPKSDGRWRPCGDFRRLNNVTENDHYPIPHIQDFSAHLAGTSVFSKIDLVRGYHQVPVRAEDVPKTAVITPFGLFEFLRTFQRLMDSVLRGLPFVFVYLDDILVASSSKEQHMFRLRQIFSAEGAVPLPDKVRAVSEFPRPTNVKALQEYLGMVNFYNRFLPRVAHLLKPLYGALKGKKANDSVDWFPESIQAFSDAKSALANAALLAHPSPSAPIALTTDASDIAVGAVLEQRISGVWQPLAFFSRTLCDSERNYSVFDRELLALHLATRHFRFFLEGRHFTAYVDHKPLTFAMSKVSDPWSARQQRQLAAISEFTTDIRTWLVNPIMWLTVCPDYSAMAADQSGDPDILALKSTQTGLILEDRPMQDGGPLLVCDVSTGRPRPVVPVSWRRRVFDSVHALSHPGVRAAVKLVSSKFVWPGLRKSVKEWASACIPCQRAKVHKHTKAPLEQFFIPGKRFDHVHVDLVGPLPQSKGFTHLLTVVDRTTRWLEAVPLASTIAAVVAKAFLSTWVSRFSPPADITSDRGPQFISELWSAMADGLGAKVHRTTAYNPQANGTCERFHRSLKAAFRASLKDGVSHERIASAFDSIVEEYGIGHKISYILTDNASNMKRVFKVRMPEVEHPEGDSSDDLDDETMWEDAEDSDPWSTGERLSCFAHSLQLVISDGIKEVKAIASAIAKASKFTNLLHSSSNHKDLFGAHFGSNKSIPAANNTRWNSTYRQLKALITLDHRAITEMCSDTENLVFSAREWAQLKDLCALLEPFSEATRLTKGDHQVTISMVVPTVLDLKNHLIKMEVQMPQVVSIVRALKRSLEKRFSGIFRQICMDEKDPEEPFSHQIYHA